MKNGILIMGLLFGLLCLTMTTAFAAPLQVPIDNPEYGYPSGGKVTLLNFTYGSACNAYGWCPWMLMGTKDEMIQFSFASGLLYGLKTSTVDSQYLWASKGTASPSYTINRLSTTNPGYIRYDVQVLGTPGNANANWIDVFPITQDTLSFQYKYSGNFKRNVNIEVGKITSDQLKGTGDAYACIHADGTLFRSNTPCVVTPVINAYKIKR